MTTATGPVLQHVPTDSLAWTEAEGMRDAFEVGEFGDESLKESKRLERQRITTPLNLVPRIETAAINICTAESLETSHGNIRSASSGV